MLEGTFDLEQKKMQFGFRRAFHDDAPDVRDLFGHYYLHYHSGKSAGLSSRILTFLASAGETFISGGSFWVARDMTDDTLAGCFFLDFPNPDYVALSFFTIDPKLIKTLFPLRMAQFATAKAQDLGARDVCLWNGTSFTEAASCFRELGYNPTDAKRRLDNDSSFEEVCYARSLWYQPK